MIDGKLRFETFLYLRGFSRLDFLLQRTISFFFHTMRTNKVCILSTRVESLIYFPLYALTRLNEKFVIRYRDQPDILLPNEAPPPLPFTLGEQLDFSASNHDKQVDSGGSRGEHDCSRRSRVRTRSLNVCLCLSINAHLLYAPHAAVPKLLIAFDVDVERTSKQRARRESHRCRRR